MPNARHAIEMRAIRRQSVAVTVQIMRSLPALGVEGFLCIYRPAVRVAERDISQGIYM